MLAPVPAPLVWAEATPTASIRIEGAIHNFCICKLLKQIMNKFSFRLVSLLALIYANIQLIRWDRYCHGCL